MSFRNKTFQYRLARPISSAFPGAHPGQMVGAGQLFKRHEPLIASPDPRRLDLRASMLDPFSDYRVRVYQQKSTLPVYLIADLSISMTFTGHITKPQTLRDLFEAIAQSALDYGDSFGFIGCGRRIETQFLLPAGRQPGRIRMLLQNLVDSAFTNSSDGLEQAAHYLPGGRALVFLASDFHFETNRLTHILHSLNRHHVVPLVIWDELEFRALPQWGLVKYRDMESGATRTLLMRPKLKQAVNTAFERRRERLQQCFRAFGTEALFLEKGYQAEQFNAYFQQRAL